MTAAAKTKPVRCAIYTRKSTEEGLDQSFNTLDAQREACAAYVLSQAGEGWTALPQYYDDGGYSGGNLDRPAIRQLLDDVDKGAVDVIVVYKVDRLTRSLADFAKIVERLDARGASFVSVTQAFNTTSSMGRLTLNVLLSFAQFEREVTGERIRDKIAASKAKGMWMGGSVPLGYDLGERRLVVNNTEAELVRHLFARYAGLRSGVALVRELRREGVLTKRWQSRTGQYRGGIPFSCGALYYILQNRLYLGEIVHRGVSHPGDHASIVDAGMFEEVQQALAANRRKRRAQVTRTGECQLVGLVHQRNGAPLTTSFSYGRGNRLYRYYVAGSLDPARPAGSRGPLRVPAGPLERLVLGSLSTLQANRLDWMEARSLLLRVEIWDRSVQLVLQPGALAEPHEESATLVPKLRARLAEERLVIGIEGEFRLIIDRAPMFRGGKAGPDHTFAQVQNQSTRDMLRAAHRLLEEHDLSPLRPHVHSAGRAPADQRKRYLMVLGLLAPSLQRRILERGCGSELLRTKTQMPLAWADQVRVHS